jgi:hypothetical protein
MEQNRSFDTQDRKEQRRHKRRKLKRYVKKAKGFPSFVDMLAIDYDEATSSSDGETQCENGGGTGVLLAANNQALGCSKIGVDVLDKEPPERQVVQEWCITNAITLSFHYLNNNGNQSNSDTSQSNNSNVASARCRITSVVSR